MKASMWNAAKDAMSFAWHMKETILVFAGLSATAFVGLLWFGQSFSLFEIGSINDFKNTTFEQDGAANANYIDAAFGVYQLIIYLFASYYFQNFFIRKKATPLTALEGNIFSYLWRLLVVRLGVFFVVAVLLTLGTSDEIIVLVTILAGILLVGLLPLELSITAATVNSDDQTFATAMRLGKQYVFKMLWPFFAVPIITSVILIPAYIISGFIAVFGGVEIGDFLFYVNIFISLFTGGIHIAVLALVHAAYYCALRPEYVFFDGSLLYSIGEDVDPEAETQSV